MTQAVLDGVRDLLPAFRERADETERLRQVPDASVKELEETGFFRMLQPKRFDGLEGDPIDFYTAVSLIASACGSTGWISSVLGVHPWQVALFHDDAQQAVWGDDTSTRLSSSYAPTGKATIADGGFTLRGPLELLLRLGARDLGAARRPRLQRRGPGRRLQDVHGAAREVRDRRRLERGRPVRHRLQRHRGRGDVHPRGVHPLDGRHRPLLRPGPGAEPRRPLQAAVPLAVHHDHQHADHRHGSRRVRRARRDAAEARARGLRRREGVLRSRSPPYASRVRPARSTRPGP